MWDVQAAMDELAVFVAEGSKRRFNLSQSAPVADLSAQGSEAIRASEDGVASADMSVTAET
jgi:hypothetical protein